MAFRHCAFLAVALMSGMAGRFAQAAGPSAQEKETARAMMDEGHARRDAGDHKAALAQFQGADAIMHVPTTGLEVAREQIALRLLAEARDTLRRITSMPSASNEPEAFRAAHEAAKSLDDDLAGRIPSLRISVSGVPDGASFEVMVDDVRVPGAALIAPFKVNPGHHLVTATAAAGSAREEVDVTDGQTAAVALSLSQSNPPAEPVAPRPDAGANSNAEGRRPSPIVPWFRWGGFGLAVVGVGVGSVAGAMSISTTSAAKKSCVSDRCPPNSWSDIDSSRTTATISTISFMAAGVGAALGITSFAIGRTSASSSSTPSTGPHVAVWIGPGMAGLSGTL